MLSALIVAASVAFLALCHVYDTTMTVRGLKAGVAVEGSSWLIGNKPSAKALYLRDGVVGLLVSAPAIWGALTGNTPLALPFCFPPILYGVFHIHGGEAWRKLLRK